MRSAFMVTVGMLLSLSAMSRSAHAQAGDQSDQPVEAMAQIPPEASLLALRVRGPESVRVGDSFQYEIEVKNESESLVVRDLRLAQADKKALTIEQTKVVLDPPNRDKAKETDAANKANKAKTGKPAGQQSAAAKSPPPDGGKGQWTIAKLEPGQTARIQVTAVSDNEGQAPLCVNVTSYKTGVCLATKVVNPQLEIVKTGPEQATLCGTFEYKYSVKNTGTGNVGTFTVEDDLDPGLKTNEEDNRIRFQVESLAAGEVRTFIAEITPTKAGEFKSRAVATEKDGAKTRSQPIATTIVESRPAVAIDGPRREYIGSRFDYVVRVTNQGKTAAAGARLVLHYPSEIRFTRIGEPEPTQQKVVTAPASAPPTPAPGDPAGQDGETASPPPEQTAAEDAGDMERRTWELGDLAPGQTIQVTFSIIPQDDSDIKLGVVAEFVCNPGDDQSLATSTAAITTKIITIPALAVAVADEKDPVSAGQEVTYEVLVFNEGTGTDKNVVLSIPVPEQLEYVSSSGDTKGSLNGQTLAFEPVATLPPGGKVSWEATFRVKDQTSGASIRLPAEVKSDSVTETVSSEEPTRLLAEMDQTGTGQ